MQLRYKIISITHNLTNMNTYEYVYFETIHIKINENVLASYILEVNLN